LANQPKSFSDYMAEAQKNLGQSSSKKASSTKLPEISRFGSGAAGSAQAQQGTGGVLGTLMDLLTRPLSGVTNTIQSAVNRSVDAQQALKKGDVGGYLGNMAGNIGGGLGGDFLAGLLSTNPEQHRTTSDVIEESTDKIAPMFDPKYVDTADNVNPVLKGVAGFAGDIALDPLTWIPGTQVAKAAGLGVKGVKAAVEGVSAVKDAVVGGVRAAKTADTAAEEAAKEAAKIARPTAVDASEAAASKLTRAAEDEQFQKIQAAREGELSGMDLDSALSSSENRIADLARSDLKVASASTKGQQVARALDMFKPVELKGVTSTPPITAKTVKPLPFSITQTGDYVTHGWLHDVVDQVAKLPEPSDFQKKISVVAQAAIKGDPKALKTARSIYDQTYVPSFAQAKQQGKILGSIGQIIPEQPGTTKTTTTILDSLGSYRKAMADNEAQVTSQLGPQLSQTLSQYKTPESFEKVVTNLRGILDQSIDVPTMQKLSAPAEQMIRQIGLDPATIPVGVKPFQALKNEQDMAVPLTEVLARAAGDENAVERGLAEQGLKSAVFRDIVEPHSAETEYKYATKTGTLRTEDKFGEGIGRSAREANNYFQWNLVKGIIATTGNEAKKAGLFAMRRAAYVSRTVRAATRLAERALDAKGIPLTMGVGLDRIPLSQSQMWDVLDKIDADGVTYRTIWNGGTAVPPTNLMDAVYAAVKGANHDEIVTMLAQTTTRYTRADGREVTLPNNLVKGGYIGPSKIGGRPSKVNFRTGEQLTAELSGLIERAAPTLQRIVSANADSLAARRISETYEMTDGQLQTLENLYQSKGGFADLLTEINDTTPRVQGMASHMGAMQQSTNLATTAVKAFIPQADQDVARAASATEHALKQPAAVGVLQREAEPIQQKAYEDVMADEPFVSGGNVTDLGEKTDQMLGRGIVAKVLPIFSRKAGTELIYPEWMRSENVYRTVMSHFHEKLGALQKAVPRQQLANALQNARNGVAGDDVTTTMRDLWGQMFGLKDGRRALTDNSFFRNNTAIDHINAMFDRNGVPEAMRFNVEAAQKAAKLNGTSVMEEASKQAQEWAISDPVDTMSRLYKSFVDTQVHHTLAQDFMKKAKDLGATSKAPKDGYSLVGNDSGRSIFSSYLPNNVYIRDDVLHQMHVVDNLTQQTMELSGPLGKFVREVYQPLQQAWKYGMTLPNPTHHIRNLIGDYSLTYYANGVKGAVKANKSALQAMATHNNYTGWDAIAALQGYEMLPDAGHIVAEGKLGKVTADGLYTALANRGNLLSFRQLEQLNLAGDVSEGKGPLASLWHAASHSGVAEKIGGISEARDHFSRVQHAAQFIIQNIDSKSYKSMDELLDAASDEARKWHPDGTDMTRAEQYLRLLIPFYSWQRKAIPLVVESMLTHPGRITSIPKAEYAIATAAGVDPDSLSDPFPQDQMFPSYLTNQITGPIAEIDGKYYGVNPGFVANDILNDYVGSNPARTLLGSVSPLIRAPFELAAGGQVATGGKINDDSDYVDSQIPGVSVLARLTGYSPTGSAASILQGGGLDQQYQIAKGNKDPVGGPAISALNWLTGLGITPMSQQNQINGAEIEKRNAAGAAQSGRSSF
jgi:hypothetical protein